MSKKHSVPEFRSSMNLIIIVTMVLWALMFTAPATGQEAEIAAEYSSGTELCLSCHNKLKETKMGHARFLSSLDSSNDVATAHTDGQHFCEACHGPAATHAKRQAGGSRAPLLMSFSQDTPAQDKNTTCLNCHNDDTGRTHWADSPHDIADTACVDCHGAHAEVDPVMSLSSQSGVCYDCHEDKNQVVQAEQTLQVLEHSEMNCSDCHNSHAGLDEVLCVDCHQQNDAALALQSPKALDFHKAGKKNNVSCSSCHRGVAHGLPDLIERIRKQQHSGDYDIYQIFTRFQ